MPKQSPLSIYKETAQKFGLTGERLLATDQQLAHIQTQITEIKIICNRTLVDIVGLRMNMEASQDEMSKSAYSDGIAKHHSELRQLSNKLVALETLQKELEAEAPSSTPAIEG